MSIPWRVTFIPLVLEADHCNTKLVLHVLVPASLGSLRPERQVGPGSERGRERAHCLVFGEFSGGYLRSIEIFKLFHI